MPGAFKYKPRVVDIRVRPPRPEEEAAEADVLRLKPGETACEWPGCRKAATARAPKSRERLGEHYAFCQGHAGEYNKSWDFFAGMSEGEIRAHQEARATGERPTWSFKASNRSREAAAMFGRGQGAGQSFSDPFGIFSAARRRQAQAAEAAQRMRTLGRLERKALADLDLDEASAPAVIRARYLDLVKRCHPDSNGGDRSMEHKLQRVLKAYRTLKAAKLVD